MSCKLKMAYWGGTQGAAAADQRTIKAIEYQHKNHASEPSQQGWEVANTYRSTANELAEDKIIRVVRECFHEHNRQHGVEQGNLRQYIARLEQEIASKNRELSRGVPDPYGSYSGANPQLLHRYLGNVLNDLDNFAHYSIPREKPIEIANFLKAHVSEIFFSKFERLDFGVKGESLFAIPGLLPEKSYAEFRDFDAYADEPEDEALKPYMPKYRRFLAYKREKFKKTCDRVEFKKTCGQVEFNDDSSPHFDNLAMNLWMLHKLTFSFERANVRLMRVVSGDPFNGEYMESVDQLKEKPPATTATVKHVILPGLWINNSVIKCRVCLGSATGQEPSTAPATQLLEGDAAKCPYRWSAGAPRFWSPHKTWPFWYSLRGPFGIPWM